MMLVLFACLLAQVMYAASLRAVTTAPAVRATKYAAFAMYKCSTLRERIHAPALTGRLVRSKGKQQKPASARSDRCRAAQRINKEPQTQAPAEKLLCFIRFR